VLGYGMYILGDIPESSRHFHASLERNWNVDQAPFSAIISGSLDILIDTLYPDHPFDHVLINRLIFDPDGRLTGGQPTPYDMEKKAEGLNMLSEETGIPLFQSVFIGDHFNDVHIARKAGLSIAFNSKSRELDTASDVVIHSNDIRTVIKEIEVFS